MLTGLYCLHVYQQPQPTAYDPVSGATVVLVVHYMPRRWVDSTSFFAFIDHFDDNVNKNDGLVILLILIDSLS